MLYATEPLLVLLIMQKYVQQYKNGDLAKVDKFIMENII